jgi:hypothetical protein
MKLSQKSKKPATMLVTAGVLPLLKMPFIGKRRKPKGLALLLWRCRKLKTDFDGFHTFSLRGKIITDCWNITWSKVCYKLKRAINERANNGVFDIVMDGVEEFVNDNPNQ